MVRLSERVDMLERRLTKLGASMSEDSEIGTVNDSETKTKLEFNERSGNVLPQVIEYNGCISSSLNPFSRLMVIFEIMKYSC